MKPYSIYAPPFDMTSGGIRVVWGLYGWLLAKGCEAYPNVLVNDGSKLIGVYPEIVNGNPLHATTVVRYILNKPGAMMGNGVPGPLTYPDTDKKFVFSRIFDTFNTDEDHMMFLPIINLHIFKDQHKQRTRTCYLVGKGINTNVHPQDAILINRTFAQDQQALADLLNECHTLYCYDAITAMMDIARLCGCRVVVIPSIYTKEDFKKYELCQNFNGISWGLQEERRLETQMFRDLYEDMYLLMDDKIDFFIEETQRD